MKDLLKRFRFFLVMLMILIGVMLVDHPKEIKALGIMASSLKEMLLVIPPVFILLGLLDVWVPKETMVRHMGEGSGLKGVVLAVLLGSAAAGPLYGAFPVAGVFLKKGVSLSNILIFLGAWSTTKIPMFLFEWTSLGGRFALTRLVVDIPGIIIIAWLICKLVPEAEQARVYQKAEKL
ncbi:MAG TPA: permease [Bacillota bacterium]|nr:permease [Bacillota bacterium]HOL09031.1 permease [Bacillota bacterium]HPO96706.1 permease [Bacillota bacterium]